MEGETGIGPYRIDAEIAHSSICTIYRAWEPSLDRPVLIKKLHPQMSREEDIRKRFEREAQVCARVKHENIVDIYGYRADEDVTMLVMEFVEGQSLGELISKRGRIEWKTVLIMLAGVLKGLAYAHSKGVTHRDIKPDNLLVSDEGRVKITDFGLAIISDSSRMTVQGAVVGTPAYLPPEQVSGGVYDFRGDLFSTGVTIYEALTGVSPFSGQSFSETLKKILTYSPPSPSSLLPDIPAEFDQILARLLEKQPSKRYASAEQALEDVKKLAALKGVILESVAIQKSLDDSAASGRLPVITPLPIPIWRTFNLAGYATVFASAVIALSIILLTPTPKTPDHADVSPKYLTQVKAVVQAAFDRNKLITLPKSPDTVSVAETKIPTAKNGKTENPPNRQNIQNPVIGGKTRESISAAKPSTAPGQLLLTCKPWGNITIDNIPYGQTPLSSPLELKPGAHLVALTNPEFPAPFVQTIQIQSDSVTSLDVNFWSIAGIVNVRSVRPWAEIYVDGTSYGTTPRAKPIIVPFGKHLIELRNPAYQVWTQEVTFSPNNSSLDLTVTLEERK